MKGGAEFWDKPENRVHSWAQNIGCLLISSIFGIPLLLMSLITWWWQTLLVVACILFAIWQIGQIIKEFKKPNN